MSKQEWTERLRTLWEKTIGMRLAYWLDQRHPDWCWPMLHTHIGKGWGLLSWREDVTDIAMCKRDCERNGVCWCGKLRSKNFTGDSTF